MIFFGRQPLNWTTFWCNFYSNSVFQNENLGVRVRLKFKYLFFVGGGGGYDTFSGINSRC